MYPPPQAGNHPGEPTVFGSGATVTSYTWKRDQDGKILGENDKFTPGIYILTMELTADKDRLFRQSAKATVNGEEAVVSGSETYGSKITVTDYFPVGKTPADRAYAGSWSYPREFVYGGTEKALTFKPTHPGVTMPALTGNAGTHVGSYSASVTTASKDDSNYAFSGSYPTASWEITAQEQAMSSAYGTDAAPYLLAVSGSVNLRTLLDNIAGTPGLSYAFDGGVTPAGATLTDGVLGITDGASGTHLIKVTAAPQDKNSDGTADIAGATAAIYVKFITSAKNPVTVGITQADGIVIPSDSIAAGARVSLPAAVTTGIPDGATEDNIKIIYSGVLRDTTAAEYPSTNPPSFAGKYTATLIYEDDTRFGSASCEFTIAPLDISAGKLNLLDSSGNPCTSAVYTGLPIAAADLPDNTKNTITIDGKTITPLGMVHFVITPFDDIGINAGEYTFGYNGTVSYTGTATGTFTIEPMPLTIDTATATTRAYEIGNKSVAITAVTFNETTPDTLTLGTDYTVSGELETDSIGTDKKVKVKVTMLNPNYTVADGSTTVTIAAPVDPLDLPGQEIYLDRDDAGAKTYNLADLIPDDAGTGLTYATGGAVTGAQAGLITGFDVTAAGVVSYNLGTGGNVGAAAELPLKVTGGNYGTITVKLLITLGDQEAVDLWTSDILTTYNGSPVPDTAINGMAIAASASKQVVSGSWSFTGAAPVDVADSGTKSVKFTPANGELYASGTKNIGVTINKATPDGAPGYTPITAAGKTLADAALDKSTILGVDGQALPGTLVWDDGDSKPVAANTAYNWTFTPTGGNYNILKGSITPYDVDDIPPTLLGGSAVDITQTGARLSFACDEHGTYYYLVYAAADAAPGAAAVKAQGAAVAKGTDAANASSNTATVSGLIAATAYKAYVVVEDAAGNLSSPVLEIPFTTASEAPITYTVTFNANGGGVSTPTATTGADGKLASLPTPIRSGYSFKGWYTAASGGTQVTTATVFTENKTIYAQWNTQGGGNVSSGGSSVAPSGPSWSGLTSDASKLKDGDSLTVDMKGTETLPADFLKNIAGKDVDVTLDMGGGLTWIINGADVPTAGSLPALNLGVSTGGTALEAMVKNIDGTISYVQLNIKHSGDFPIPVTLSVKLDAKNAGYFANLYYNNESTNALEFVVVSKIAADGKTEFAMTHASSYAIVVSAEDHTPTIDKWVNPFSDVKESDWFYGDVAYAVTHGLFAGTSATTFSPQLQMTRGMVVTVLGRLAGIDPADYTGTGFDDVDSDRYYAPYVKWAAALGIVNGVGDNLFAPDANITRQDLCVILSNYVEKMGLSIGQTADSATFADAADISDYAAAAVTAMARAGVVSGKPGGIFDPKANATRAEVAAMFHRFATSIK